MVTESKTKDESGAFGTPWYRTTITESEDLSIRSCEGGGTTSEEAERNASDEYQFREDMGQ